MNGNKFTKRQFCKIIDWKTISASTIIALGSLKKPTFWSINLGVILVCFWVGPFGTLESLPTGIRFIYWGFIVLFSNLIALWAHKLIQTLNLNKSRQTMLASLCFGVVVSAFVVFFSLILLHPIQRYPGLLTLVYFSFPTATLVFFLSVKIARLKNYPSPIEQKERPALLSRLKSQTDGTRILSLSAQDHYVEVVTDAGSELLLLRLNDAIVEASPEEGFQIHRSHWVAKAAVKQLKKSDSKVKVLLIDGREFSISQSRLASFKKFLYK